MRKFLFSLIVINSVFFSCPPAFSYTLCGDPSSCTVTLFFYHVFPYPTTKANKSFYFEKLEDKCYPVSQVEKPPPVIGPTTAYEGVVYKFYYSGPQSGWLNLGMSPPLDIFASDGTSLISQVTYPTQFTSTNDALHANPYKYLPADCSSIPDSKAITSNTDTGKPECGNGVSLE